MAVLIVHPVDGVYLGNAMGFGFWSKIDPVGQDQACTFLSVKEAREHILSWEPPKDPTIFTYPEVIPDRGRYASKAICILAGVDYWEHL